MLLGCASLITKALIERSGVQSVNTSVEQQNVRVVTMDHVTFETVRAAIEESGKEVKGGKIVEESA